MSEPATTLAQAENPAQETRLEVAKKHYTPTHLVQKAKYLYCTKGLLVKEIAAKTGIKEKTILGLITRHKWVAERNRIQAKALAKLSDKAVTQATEALERWGAYSEDFGERVYEELDKTLDSKDKMKAKNVLAYTGAIKNLHAIVKEAAPDSKQPAGSQHVNVFIGMLGRVGDDAVDITPAKG